MVAMMVHMWVAETALQSDMLKDLPTAGYLVALLVALKVGRLGPWMVDC